MDQLLFYIKLKFYGPTFILYRDQLLFYIKLKFYGPTFILYQIKILWTNFYFISN